MGLTDVLKNQCVRENVLNFLYIRGQSNQMSDENYLDIRMLSGNILQIFNIKGEIVQIDVTKDRL